MRIMVDKPKKVIGSDQSDKKGTVEEEEVTTEAPSSNDDKSTLMSIDELKKSLTLMKFKAQMEAILNESKDKRILESLLSKNE